MQIHWEPSCSLPTDGWTDRHDKASSTFRSIAIVAEKALFRTVISDVNIGRPEVLLSMRSTTL
jgi:hypothetical protein